MKSNQRGFSLVEIMIISSVLIAMLAGINSVTIQGMKANRSLLESTDRTTLRASLTQLADCNETLALIPAIDTCATGTPVRLMGSGGATVVGIPFTFDGKAYFKATCVKGKGVQIHTAKLKAGKFPVVSPPHNLWTNPASDYVPDSASRMPLNFGHPLAEVFRNMPLLCSGLQAQVFPTPVPSNVPLIKGQPKTSTLGGCQYLNLELKPMGSANYNNNCDPLADRCDFTGWPYYFSTKFYSCPSNFPTLTNVSLIAGCKNRSPGGKIMNGSKGYTNLASCAAGFASVYAIDHYDETQRNNGAADLATCNNAGLPETAQCQIVCCKL